MKTKLALMVALALPMAGVPAVASAATDGANQQATDNRDNQTVCRWRDAVGSRLGRRTCMTRAQWRAIDSAARDNRDRVLDRAERERLEPNPQSPSPVN